MRYTGFVGAGLLAVALLGQGCGDSGGTEEVEAQACEALACGSHGSCSAASGAPACECSAGYAGARCDACAQGFQDNDHDGTCTPDCAGLSCAEHASCSDASGTAACTCAPGYSREAGACTWTGVVKDPGFQNAPQAWTLSTGATLDAAATGSGEVDPGTLTLGDGRSNELVQATQEVALPPLSLSGPLALRLRTKGSCYSCYPTAQLEVKLDGRYLPVPAGNAYGDVSLCLGERHMGKRGTLALVSETPSYATQTVTLDRVSIEPEPTCPRPGEVFNGDFERADGWSATGAAVLQASTGVDGSRGAHLAGTYGHPARLQGSVSIPDAPRQALEFSAAGSGDPLNVRLGDLLLGRIAASGAWTRYQMCLPDGLRGLGSSLSFAVDGAYGVNGNGTWDVDGVHLVEDASCGDAAPLPNAGFESTGNPNAWSITGGYGVGWEFLVDPAVAKSGVRSMHFSSTEPCSDAYFANLVTVPQPKEGAGPAVRYWTKRSGTHLTARALIGDWARVGSEWTQHTDCLSPRVVGRTMQYQLWVYGGGGLCANTFPTEHVWVDDFEVTTDAACPVE